MAKSAVKGEERSSLANRISGSGKEDGRVIVHLPDSFAANVSCDVFKYLSMKEFYTHFIDRRDITSFNALHCKPLGFNVTVRVDAGEADVHMVDFFLNDHTRHNPLICTGEQLWNLLHEGEIIDEIEPLISIQDEMKVRNVADSAFKALRCAFRKKAEAELCELNFQFGRPTFGHWVGKLVLSGAITSNECRVAREGSTKNFERSDMNLSLLTEKLFS